MRLFRHVPATYEAVRTADGWDLRAGGESLASYGTYPKAADAAGIHDRKRRRIRAAAQRIAVAALAGLLLIPVMTEREVDNPDYPPARAFADRMEEAYRAVDDGTAGIDSFAAEADGFEGAVFEVDRGGVVADYNLLVGDLRGDCYVIRWVRFEVPFVARLLPRYVCAPGPPALNFAPSGFEAIAVNLATSRPLEWQPVLPDPIDLAPWFFPAMLILLMVVFQRLVALSMLYLKKDPPLRVPVERIESA